MKVIWMKLRVGINYDRCIPWHTGHTSKKEHVKHRIAYPLELIIKKFPVCLQLKPTLCIYLVQLAD